MPYCRSCGKEIDESAMFCPACGASQELAELPPVFWQEDALPGEYAGFWYRVLALLVDTVITVVAAVALVIPPAFVMGMMMANSYSLDEIEAAGELMGNVVGIVVGWLYFTVFESSSWQATPGKKMMGLQVTDESGHRIGFGRANGRYFSKFISAIILGIGYLMVAFTEKKQGLHDKIASTLVLKV